MKHNLRIAFSMTFVTTIIFGLVYPLAVIGLGQLLFPSEANGGLIVKNGQIIGSRLIGQSFSSDKYFHARPSAAGNGCDPVFARGGASNLGPTNRQLLDRVKSDVEKLHVENPSSPIPIDLVTTSGSGLDPDISPAAAEFQIPRVARAPRRPSRTAWTCCQTHRGKATRRVRRAAHQCSGVEFGSRSTTSGVELIDLPCANLSSAKCPTISSLSRG